MIDVHGYAALNAQSPLTPFRFSRREVGRQDVLIKIQYCGICHSDVHQARDEWGGSLFPMVPGHEIVGTMILVGAPDKPVELGAFPLIMRRRRLVGSLIGGIQETQEMLDFCGKHKFGADVEVIPIQQANAAYDRLVRSDVRYRFVIDMASLK